MNSIKKKIGTTASAFVVAGLAVTGVGIGSVPASFAITTGVMPSAVNPVTGIGWDLVSVTGDNYVNGDTTWYSSDGVVTLNATAPLGLETVVIKDASGTVIKTIPLAGELTADVTFELAEVTTLISGRNDLRVSVQDALGSPVEESVLNIWADVVAPTTPTAELLSPVTVTTWGIYSKTPIDVQFSATDEGTGVESIVSESGVLPEGKLSLSTSDGTVKAVDFLGQESTAVSIKGLLGWGDVPVIIDAEAPTMDVTSSGIGNSTVYEYTSTDNSALSKVEIFTNDVQLFSQTVSTDTAVTEFSGTLAAADIPAEIQMEYLGNVPLRFVATDMAGNAKTYDTSWFIDTLAPQNLAATVAPSAGVTPWANYFDATPQVTVTATQPISGIKNYELLSGNDLSAPGEVSESGVFSVIPANPYVRVTTNAGVSLDPVPLNSLLGLPTNVYLVAGELPTVEVIRPDPVVGNWYANNFLYTATVKDNTALSSYRVYVNDVEVSSKNFLDGATSAVVADTLNIDTAAFAPGADGSLNIRVEVTNAANRTSTWQEQIYLDLNTPSITGFTFNNPVTVDAGQYYGYYFQGATEVTVNVADEGISSGIKQFNYRLVGSDGKVVSEGVSTSNVIAVPENFKGRIEVTTEDNVGRISALSSPEGVVSENSNWNVSTASARLEMPGAGYATATGQSLYSQSITFNARIKEPVAGVKSISWGVGDVALGSIDVPSDGNYSGNGVTVISKDQNLATEVTVPYSALGDGNNQRVWVTATSRTGHSVSSEQTVSVDTVAPVIEVSPIAEGYYNSNQSARITVRDANFDPAGVSIGGVAGTLSGWTQSEVGVWSADMTFADEVEYGWTMQVTDRAGHTSGEYRSSTFTVDKTAPALDVTFSNNNVQNNTFYKDERIATISVTDKTFDPTRVSVEGASTGGWSQNGDTWTTTAAFSQDGQYSLAVSVTDKAGNTTQPYASGQFEIDRTVPTVKVEGLETGTSYKKDLSGTVTIADKNTDTTRTTVSLTGRANGEIKLDGSIIGTGGTIKIPEFAKDKKWDDLYTLKIQAVDLAGNVVEQNLQFSVNRFGSMYAFQTQDYKGKYVQKVDKPVVSTVTSVDQLDMGKFETVVTLNGDRLDVQPELVKASETGGTEGNWVYYLSMDPAVFDSDGVYRLQVYSSTLGGDKSGSLDQEYGFVVVSQAPELVVTGVEQGEIYNDNFRDVAVDVRGLAPVETISATIDGEAVEVAESGGGYSVRMNEGSEVQTLTVKVVDAAGNESETSINDVYISSSWFSAAWHQGWPQVVLGVLGVALAGLATLFGLKLLAARRHQKNQDAQSTELRSSASDSLGSASNQL